ncbi:hypothetical protein DPMN_042438 [Dreissena polymorpha]|uniref:Uncharacterized protein n=1 Tax=Dreissena polymorpha TaxID=45954 RepID=A0A9D4HX18_DREPO|nr:hypothetical protein DPMN_042438 [Dreissena polymorpha]
MSPCKQVWATSLLTMRHTSLYNKNVFEIVSKDLWTISGNSSTRRAFDDTSFGSEEKRDSTELVFKQNEGVDGNEENKEGNDPPGFTKHNDTRDNIVGITRKEHNDTRDNIVNLISSVSAETGNRSNTRRETGQQYLKTDGNKGNKRKFNLGYNDAFALDLTIHFLPLKKQECLKDIIGTNILTKFHENRKINVASRVLTRKYAPPPGSHVFQPTGIILNSRSEVNVASRVLTRFYYSHTYIIETNLLTKFHEDWTINVASRKKYPAPGGHVFKATKSIFKLIQDIMGTYLLTKFHDDQKINVTSRVLTRKIAPPSWWPYRTINVASRVKNAPPLGGHVFQANVTIFELIKDIIKTNLTISSRLDNKCFTLYSHIRKNASPPGGHVFKPTSIIFELVQDIIGMNLLTKKTSPPLGSHVFQAKFTTFEVIQDISGTNLLSKFHENSKINVASRVLTRKNAPPPGNHF